MSKSIVQIIDHALLQPTHTTADLRVACAMCAELHVAAICVKPSYVAAAAELLSGSPVVVCTVIGFPHGGTTTSAKVAETELACRGGAREVDVVVNLGRVLAGEWSEVKADIQAVVEAACSGGALTKVILETGLLPDDDTKIRLCELSAACGAAFVKTSTGFGHRQGPDGLPEVTGATDHDVRLLRTHCGPALQVKASGGIRSYADALRFASLGATRLGTSHTLEIAAGERSRRPV